MDTTKVKTAVRKAAIFPFVILIKFYRVCISPYKAPSCRYTPTCSTYALQAFRRHGPFKGFYLTVSRLLRCQPWGGSGYDPVPEKFTFRPWAESKRLYHSYDPDGLASQPPQVVTSPETDLDVAPLRYETPATPETETGSTDSDPTNPDKPEPKK